MTDNKILTSWNGLMISALAYAAGVLDQPRYAKAARMAADFVLTRLRRRDELLHRYREGEAAIAGNLEDYAFLAAALLDLYEATFEARWYDEARLVTEQMVQQFADQSNGGFFFAARDSEVLAPVKDAYDGATPSGNAVAALTLLRLAEFTSDDRLRHYAERTLRAFWPLLDMNPAGSTHLLCALDFQLGTPKEIVVAGERSTPQTQALLRAVRQPWIPNKVVALRASGDSPTAQHMPLLEGKNPVKGQPTVYVCENYTCKLPLTAVRAVSALLSAASDAAAA
jgi:uncharacterized protein YyaL (SSP411 family)